MCYDCLPKSSSGPHFSFSLVLLLSMTPYGMEYLIGQLGVSCPSVSSPTHLCNPSLLAGGVGSRKGLDAVRALLSNNKNIPVSTLFLAQIQNMAAYQLL